MGRRATLLALLSVVALVLSSCIWPEYRFGPKRTGYNPDETTITLANVGSLAVKWTASVPSNSGLAPAVANGSVYAAGGGSLRAFSAAGTTGCSGTPKVCTPLWTGFIAQSASAPSVSGGVVYVGGYVMPLPENIVTGTLYAFDAAGAGACTGTPKVCDPLWTATTPFIPTSPTVTGGNVYLAASGLEVYDAAGSVGCSGTPKVCTPVRRSLLGVALGSAAVGDSTAYANIAGQFTAFDTTSTTGCTGSAPLSCPSKWQSDPFLSTSTPAVGDTKVFTGADDGVVRAFTIAATFPRCVGTPKVCDPIWTFTTGGAVSGAPALANGVVYVVSADHLLYALDANTGAKLWSANLGAVATSSSPVVAGDVLYIGTDGGDLLAFDPTGTQGCSGTPKVCTPVWTVDLGAAVGDPVVANGTLYVSTFGNTLYAFGLPAA